MISQPRFGLGAASVEFDVVFSWILMRKSTKNGVYLQRCRDVIATLVSVSSIMCEFDGL